MAAEAREGRWGDIVLDGPLDVRTSCDAVALHVKGIGSPLEGRADALVFPDIEAGNTFYKCMTYFAHAATAGMLSGPPAGRLGRNKIPQSGHGGHHRRPPGRRRAGNTLTAKLSQQTFHT